MHTATRIKLTVLLLLFVAIVTTILHYAEPDQQPGTAVPDVEESVEPDPCDKSSRKTAYLEYLRAVGNH